MRTKDQIKHRGLKLFNRLGVQNVTLRDIAAAIKKSYGNVTYHFPNKEALVSQLYDDMLVELNEISEQMTEQKDVFSAILKAPELTFELSVKYIFLFKDLTEIRRTFPELAKRIDQSNRTRKEALIGVLRFLQAQDILRADLDDKDLDYIMELSGAMRTMFFIQHDVSLKPGAAVKASYVDYVNRLLKPYLAEGYTV
ncbi:MAG: TetR/AcrR family transcriptional regulator [Chitinophagaceae bacterium]